MLCPQCNQSELFITQAEDSYYKVIKCPCCLFQRWLNNLNKKIYV